MAEATTVRLTSSLPSGRVGMWVLISGEMIIFAGLIACYLLYRFRYPEWGELARHTSTPIGAFNTFVLLTSSYTVVLAHKAVQRRNNPLAVRLLGITVLLGGVFLLMKGVEYTHEIQAGYTIFSSLFWSFYYAMTGLHALHVLVGMIALGVVAILVKNHKTPQRVEYAGMYWHMVDVIWVFLFPLLYLAH
jgi:heme/copper-type cytochrome/quinol oxidase subunit 3